MTTPTDPYQSNGYAALLGDLKERIRSARLRAALAVNQELVLLYWSIGRDILARQLDEGWGARVIDRLSADLRRDFPEMTGLSARNLNYMRAFAEAHPDREIVQQVVARLPWGHNVRLVETVKDQAERLWYARQAVEHGWSRNVLVHQIESGLFHRQGKAATNFGRTLPSPQSELAQQLIKDPYSFDFLALGPEVSERQLERGLLEHIRALILELGKGFAFVGSQYHLQVAGQDYYLDLLFYHLRLRCFVVIDLKIEEFKPEFAGKMNFYLSAADDLLRHADDAPSIGIILCKGRNAIVVEYALRGAAKPMGVAEYRLSPALPTQLQADLPTAEEFAREFPLMSLVELRGEVERELRAVMGARGSQAATSDISEMLNQLGPDAALWEGMPEFEAALRTMNGAAHGVPVEPQAAENALAAGNRFLDELRRLRTG
jgi:predicted nuclease of restriction endonuclease-like (RecB) superfamily